MDQPIAFRLLASREESLAPLEGMAMELEDSLYPLLGKAQPVFPLGRDCVRQSDCMKLGHSLYLCALLWKAQRISPWSLMQMPASGLLLTPSPEVLQAGNLLHCWH